MDRRLRGPRALRIIQDRRNVSVNRIANYVVAARGRRCPDGLAANNFPWASANEYRGAFSTLEGEVLEKFRGARPCEKSLANRSFVTECASVSLIEHKGEVDVAVIDRSMQPLSSTDLYVSQGARIAARLAISRGDPEREERQGILPCPTPPHPSLFSVRSVASLSRFLINSIKDYKAPFNEPGWNTLNQITPAYVEL